MHEADAAKANAARPKGAAMKLRLLTALLAAAALGGCTTYGYSGGSGSGPGGYYHGRPTVDYYGPYGGSYGYGYPSYGYPAYGASSFWYGRSYYPRHYGGHYPYYPVRPNHPRPPRPDQGGQPGGSGDRPPPWRMPDGRYRDSGSVMVPSHAEPRVQAPSQPLGIQQGRPEGRGGIVPRPNIQRDPRSEGGVERSMGGQTPARAAPRSEPRPQPMRRVETPARESRATDSQREIE